MFLLSIKKNLTELGIKLLIDKINFLALKNLGMLHFS